MPAIGSIFLYAGEKDNLPSDYLLCDGRLVNKKVYVKLFNVLEDTFGKDENNPQLFGLPNLKSRMPIGIESSQNINQMDGSFYNDYNNNPVHSHTVSTITSEHTHDITGLEFKTFNQNNNWNTGGKSPDAYYGNYFYYPTIPSNVYLKNNDAPFAGSIDSCGNLITPIQINTTFKYIVLNYIIKAK
jgi:microcystin-dependent protein